MEAINLYFVMPNELQCHNDDYIKHTKRHIPSYVSLCYVFIMTIYFTVCNHFKTLRLVWYIASALWWQYILCQRMPPFDILWGMSNVPSRPALTCRVYTYIYLRGMAQKVQLLLSNAYNHTAAYKSSVNNVASWKQYHLRHRAWCGHSLFWPYAIE